METEKNQKEETQHIRVRKLDIKVRKMADSEEGAAAPNQRQGQNQQQDQRAAGKQHLHINWSNFKPEFLGKPEEDADIPMIG